MDEFLPGSPVSHRNRSLRTSWHEPISLSILGLFIGQQRGQRIIRNFPILMNLLWFAFFFLLAYFFILPFFRGDSDERFINFNTEVGRSFPRQDDREDAEKTPRINPYHFLPTSKSFRWLKSSDLTDFSSLPHNSTIVGYEEKTKVRVGLCLAHIEGSGMDALLPSKVNFDGNHLCQFALPGSDGAFGTGSFDLATGTLDNDCWVLWSTNSERGSFPLSTQVFGWIKPNNNPPPESSDVIPPPHYVPLGICKASVGEGQERAVIPGYFFISDQPKCIVEYFGRQEPTDFLVYTGCLSQ